MSQLPKIRSSEGKDAVRRWWRGLQENHGQRAMLSRAGSILEVAFCPSFHDLRRQVSGGPEQLALVAGVLAKIRIDAKPESFAKRLAAPKPGGKIPCMSGLRFRRLLRIEDNEELLRLMRRAIALTGNNADPGQLAADLVFWNGPFVKRKWAEDYYDTAKSED